MPPTWERMVKMAKRSIIPRMLRIFICSYFKATK